MVRTPSLQILAELMRPAHRLTPRLAPPRSVAASWSMGSKFAKVRLSEIAAGLAAAHDQGMQKVRI